jgi:glycosyltransferase involved in cell wall biosynthesis
MKVLWLTSWYPNRTSPTNGDFTERHAQAVAQFVQQLTIIHIVKDESLAAGTSEIVKEQRNNITIYTVYYGRGRYSAIFEKLYSYKKYLALQRSIFGQIVAGQGMPDLVHVHVAMKAGLFARELKKKYRIPYIVTEHSTIYYRQAKPNLYSMGRLYREMNTAVLRDAELLLPVSKDLGHVINCYCVQNKVEPIANVVDTTLFNYQQKSDAVFRFIHASYLNYQKNPEGIIAAAKMVKEKGYDFEIYFLGKEDEGLKKMARDNELECTVFFYPAVPYSEVARYMQQADAFVLFSRFENLPCVLLEALCCGLPVISSNVGGIKEIINDDNGMLVASEDVTALANAMQAMIRNSQNYNRQQIAANAAALYNYDAVGRQYAEVYQSVIEKSKTPCS